MHLFHHPFSNTPELLYGLASCTHTLAQAGIFPNTSTGLSSLSDELGSAVEEENLKELKKKAS